MPVGPNDDAADTVESLLAYLKSPRVIVVIDDTAGRRTDMTGLARRAPHALGRRLAPSRAGGPGPAQPRRAMPAPEADCRGLRTRLRAGRAPPRRRLYPRPRIGPGAGPPRVARPSGLCEEPGERGPPLRADGR